MTFQICSGADRCRCRNAPQEEEEEEEGGGDNNPLRILIKRFIRIQ